MIVLPKRNFHILFVDDNPDDREFYADLLHECVVEDRTYTLTAAASYSEAQALCEQHTFDVFMIDYNMNEADGEEMLHALSKRFDNCAVPALILTGAPSQQQQAIAARAGAMDYVVKDVHSSPEKIDKALQKVINWANDINK